MAHHPNANRYSTGARLHTEVLIPSKGFNIHPRHPWKIHNVVPGEIKPYKPLHCECGKIAFYLVNQTGYCEGHKTEAYAAQAVYWVEKSKEMYKSIRRRVA